MGHGGHLREEFEALVDRLEAGPVAFPMPGSPAARAAWQEILEILFTPEQARLCAQMPTQASKIEVVARRWGMTPQEALPHLEAMADKALVFDLVNPQTGETRWLLAPPINGFLNFAIKPVEREDPIPKARMARALEAYMFGDDTFIRDVIGETAVYRALAHEHALDQDQLAEVLDWERATQIIADASAISLSICECRHTAQHLGRSCDAPMETCLTLNYGAEFVIKHGFGRRIDKAKALEVLAEARERGLVHTMDNVRNRPTMLCCCCGCCCGPLRTYNEFELPTVTPSGFEASVDASLCRGCETCANACRVKAISMAPEPGATVIDQEEKRQLEARVDRQRCLGCGVCAHACPHGAMRMERRAERPYVPANLIEYVVRRAIEHGRLGHLMFDQGASRGSRFLNRAINVICALPPAKQALASKQLRSRFVDYVLARRSVRKLAESIGQLSGESAGEVATVAAAPTTVVAVWVLVILALLIAGLVVVLGLYVH